MVVDIVGCTWVGGTRHMVKPTTGGSIRRHFSRAAAIGLLVLIILAVYKLLPGERCAGPLQWVTGYIAGKLAQVVPSTYWAIVPTAADTREGLERVLDVLIHGWLSW